LAKVKTWVWIVIGLAAAFVLCIVALAGVSVYFFSQHVQTRTVNAAAAGREFEDARKVFSGQTPLLRLDNVDRPLIERRIEDLPASATKPTDMFILAWDPDKDHVVRVSLPFWLLRMGRRKMNFTTGDRDFDLERLNLSLEQLERVGPVLVLDAVTPSGQRVLIWTK
jgi:hypothetical protein